MPILFALYRVIMNVPAYVSGVKEVFIELATQIQAASNGPAVMEELKTAGSFYIEGKDYTQVNTIIDVLYKLQDTGKATWSMLAEKFPDMQALIQETEKSINHMNYFLGINIANSPMNIIKNGISTGAFFMAFGAAMIPVLAALTQWLNVKMMPQQTSGDSNDSMNATMKSMNMMMPLMSAFFCLSLPAGMGLYWIAGAVIRGLQQWAINKHLDKLDLDEVIKKNIEKNNRIREKKGLPPQKISDIAKTNVKNIDSDNKKKGKTEEERRAEVEASTNYYKNADKPGSLASKAAMVSKYNEKQKK
jgi:YidC/Oxa1 family membrane protein insertase